MTARFVLICALVFAVNDGDAQNPAPRLIVRGDDMGFSHAGNQAILKCFKEGIETSVEVIVPSPWFMEAVKILNENTTIDVGIHITLTSEWDNIKCRPITNCKSLTDSNGYFFPFIWPNKKYPGQALLENKWRIEEVEAEMRAQIAMGLKHIPHISHLSAHMGSYDMTPEVRKIANDLELEYGLHIDLVALNVKELVYSLPFRSTRQRENDFVSLLRQLKDGQIYLFVDHPGIDSPELRAISHKGYDNVAQDRQSVTDVWTSQHVREEIKRLKIQLISYKDLK